MIPFLLSLLLLADQAGVMPEPDLSMPVHEMHLLVVDVDGKPMQGVTVSITPVGDWSGPVRRCAARSSTGTDGRVVFKRLPGGNYDVKFEMSGYLTSELPDLPVRTDLQRNWRWIGTPEVRIVMNELTVS